MADVIDKKELVERIKAAQLALATIEATKGKLDQLVGRLAFDPLAFKDDKDQARTLRELVRLDVSTYDEQWKDAAARRAMLKKTLAIKQAQLAAMPHHTDVTAVEVSLDVVSKKMLEAESYRKLAEDAERKVASTESSMSDAMRLRNGREERVAALKTQLAHEEAELLHAIELIAEGEQILDALKITAESARAVVPDVSVIRAELAVTEATNAKVRANQKHEEAMREVRSLEVQVAEQQMAIDAANTGKAAALRAVEFPVAGLGLSDAGVTFNDLPLAQASNAEQLRVSVAIGLALNPTLKVLLVKNGNLLDDESLKAVAKQAEDAGAQMWCEWVTRDKNAVQVFIEDGHVA